MLEFLLALSTIIGIIGTGVVSYYISRRIHKLILGVEKDKLISKHGKEIIAERRDNLFRMTENVKAAERKFKSKASNSIKRSKAILKGQAIEQLVPYMEEFTDEYYAGDARFIGSPNDIIIFDGMHKEDIKQIVFMEVKTGNSRLNGRQKQIKEVIEAGKVIFKELRIKTKRVTLPHNAEQAKTGDCFCRKCIA